MFHWPKKKSEIILFTCLVIIVSVIAVHGQSVRPIQEEIVLWRKGAPGGSGPQGDERVSAKGSHTNITQPRLIVYRPEHPNGTAILVISGGGYAHIECGNESGPAAVWLQQHGVTAFELIYRLPEEGWGNADVPFQDGQRAMRIIRSKAADFGIDPHKIGVMGFSAGGHLAGMLATQFDKQFYEPGTRADQVSARPDFAALLYPVITMLPPYDHTHSENVIIGKYPDLEKQKAYSVQLHVNSQTPPTFLAQAEDDPIANVENSKMMYSALQQHSIPSFIKLFNTGGHGWGMGKPGTPETEWPHLFLKWAEENSIW